MKIITQETQNRMEPTFVVDFLESMFRMEVKNPYTRRGNTLLVSLSDHSMGKVVAPKVPDDTLPPKLTEAKVQNLATWRYVTEHDYGYRSDIRMTPDNVNKIELHNMDEFRTYVEDAVSSQLNAYFTNYLIEFMTTGEKYMLAIEDCTNRPEK